jgi:glycerophosphoryl diester phosphodiesterase
MPVPLIIAHRGDSANALENSLEAFRRALQVPADMIELDLRMTRDGGLYVMHDRRTGRTATRDLDLEQAAAPDVAALTLRNGEPVPSLGDVLALAGNHAAVNIEIKSSGAGRALPEYLRSLQRLPRLVISSFQEEEVVAVRAALPQLDCAVIYDTFSPRHVDAYRARGYTLVSLRKNTVTETLVKACHRKGIRLFVWTVDEQDEMKRCITWGIDGIYTNRPALLRDVIGRQRAAGS